MYCSLELIKFKRISVLPSSVKSLEFCFQFTNANNYTFFNLNDSICSVGELIQLNSEQCSFDLEGNSTCVVSEQGFCQLVDSNTLYMLKNYTLPSSTWILPFFDLKVIYHTMDALKT